MMVVLNPPSFVIREYRGPLSQCIGVFPNDEGRRTEDSSYPCARCGISNGPPASWMAWRSAFCLSISIDRYSDHDTERPFSEYDGCGFAVISAICCATLA